MTDRLLSGDSFEVSTRLDRRPRLVVGLSLGLTACVADVGGLSALTSARPGEDPSLSGGLVVTPGVIDFGTLDRACGGDEREGLLRNLGDTAIIIESAEVLEDDGGVFNVELPPLPFRLSPGTSQPWSVIARVAENRRHSARVVFLARVEEGLLRVERPVRALADDNPIRTDRFVQNSRRSADVLFVVDDSASMVAEQDALGRNFVAFLEAANDGLADFHIGVTTTDVTGDGERGRLVPLKPPDAPTSGRTEHIVTRASLPNPTEAFRRNALVGINGALVEQGLEAAALALTAPLAAPDGDNAGFLRPEASLALVFVSDENDGSPRPTSVYTDLFLSVKGDDPSRVSASAIVGPVPNGCDGSGGRATPGTRYLEVVRALRGRAESICTEDWGSTLARLSGVAFGLLGRFVLSGQPAGEPSITVDGNPRPRINAAGQITWDIDAIARVLTFGRQFTPPEGAVVEVQYPVTCPDDGRP